MQCIVILKHKQYDNRHLNEIVNYKYKFGFPYVLLDYSQSQKKFGSSFENLLNFQTNNKQLVPQMKVAEKLFRISNNPKNIFAMSQPS
jgi:hypothetical protein